ncbi:collagen alpha-1(I) chain-like isoform X2 [Elephas maximus indicus]|uniref:collagen alpha-1(I) chain-like isoform X2 n=1 Tax=Elephas maximus indicus TaxID=99487 RepID=UPI002116343E|nr:collagen alpha-1(I) chain-like isoform X2 [Elephas maximus indicus]
MRPAHQSLPLPRVTLSRFAVHVTILFRRLREPEETSPAPTGQFEISPPVEGAKGGEPGSEPGLEAGGRPGGDAEAKARGACSPGPLGARCSCLRGDGGVPSATCGSREGRAGRPGRGGQARPLPDPIQTIRPRRSAGRRRRQRRLGGAQPTRILSFPARALRLRGKLGAAGIPAPRLISPKRRQARDPEGKSAGCPRVSTGFLHGAGGSAASRGRRRPEAAEADRGRAGPAEVLPAAARLAAQASSTGIY